MADPTTKSELLARMQEGYSAFEALLAPLDAAQLTTPGVNGDWSIKDMLAHIATWQARAALALQAADRRETPAFDPPVTNDEEMDRFNAEIFLSHQALSLETVWRDFRTSYQQIRVAIEALSEADLFDAHRFAWSGGAPLWKLVEGDTFGHYPEHAPMVEHWLAQQKA